ncbi:MAG TPA: MFS transporter [Polyangiaceae bacterium]|jgi:EmrB/QacA subfamily drug resistance transporter|nr:MFS transporter [Polyangiaceae bacterium]
MPDATDPPAAPASAGKATDPRWSLWVAILGSTMAFVDGTVVNVALPVMERQMDAGVDAMQWVVESYALLLASLVLVGGALGDRLGRRRVFVAGVVLFSVASAGCGLAPGVGFLIGARAVQGVGAALLVPGSLALIGAAYPEKTRGAAIGTWSAATSIAGAIGPLLGGWVVERLSWRVVFFFNVPVGAVVALLATRRVAETRDSDAGKRTDVLGASLATVALGAIVWALLEAPSFGGIASVRALVPLLSGVLLLAVFVVVEARVKAPMVPLELFRSRAFTGTNLVTLFLYAALGACTFFVPFDLIQVQHYSPAAAGAALMPMVVLISSLSRFVGGLVPRYGARLPLVVGPLLAACGFALLAVPSVGGSYWTTFFPGISVLGLAMGVTVAPLTATVMGSVSARHTGVASGINNAVSRAAGLLAVAALGVVLVARFDASLDARLSHVALPSEAARAVARERPRLAAAELPANLDAALRHALRDAFDAAFVSGFRALMLVCACLAAVSALTTLLLLPGKKG